MIKIEDITSKKEKISLIGLGYVGMPIAVSFAKKIDVIGFDVSEDKINTYKLGIDPTKEVGNEVISQTSVQFTSNQEDIKKAKFHIVAVPTPIKADKTPDLGPIISASELLGKNLLPGSVIVYESTVYPGVTEEICVPILEKFSGLKYGVDFKVGYSPERINPGDKIHRLETITKVVSGMDQESLDLIAKVYELVVDAGVYKAESIKVAEAAKVIENSQRDINIAFMNELSIIFNKLDIDTQAVLKAAGTKWNFLNFQPGLVGGHCIGVDPYYLTYKAEETGYHSQIILAGRRINDGMGKYVVENTIKQLIKADKLVKNAKVGILGFTFKENCPDTRNTRVIDIITEFKEYGIEALVFDPEADKEEAIHEYNLTLNDYEEMKDLDAVIIAVNHEVFYSYSLETWNSFYKSNEDKVLLDLKGMLNTEKMKQNSFNYWRF
ncbi:nucleotide sugar dehydrogenase [Carnobacterium maltaromaticum]|uniref:nucleotide sugar dehydrogenase n=1 Tax=Carnobacterium maltaromaticum TaxID=2751 RepID=UPI001071942B|nr:nucleotide sugar dehydrogenase [Carnobacterium maltaromaticum]TFJ71804.1 UDP-N-acetyl-D-galactosamine dehydrogenase [Carnobacterium maltaromaticum]TFJ76717.1 UDP-N-acetyl-D-galactosamine dehydrogenase [Carnobacterium maltaromaticum]